MTNGEKFKLIFGTNGFGLIAANSTWWDSEYQNNKPITSCRHQSDIAAEGCKITGRQRDRIWNEVRTAIKTRKEKDICDILFDGNGGMVDDTIAIDKIIKTYDDMQENWDKFLHNGKTEKECINDRLASMLDGSIYRSEVLIK